MVTRRTPLIVGEQYHIYNRGVDKRTVFLDDHDHKRFMLLLYICNGTEDVDLRALLNKGLPFDEMFSVDKGENIVHIGAYSLMPNHFHLLTKEIVEGGITQFMEKLLTAYSMYFNRRHERTGRLWEGVFKSKHIDTTEYLNWLFSYIHLNPVELIEPQWKEEGAIDPIAVKKFMDTYQYSSYYDYFVGERPKFTILSKEEFPDYFKNNDDLEDLIKEWERGMENYF